MPKEPIAAIVARSLSAIALLSIAVGISTALFAGSGGSSMNRSTIRLVSLHYNLALDPSAGIEECIVTLISGRRITGELIRQDSLIVVIGINGIETTFQRSKVESITILAPVTTRYREMRDAIADEDIETRLALVEWLRARKAYALAFGELDSILLVEPENPQAKLLHTWLSEHEKLGAGRARHTDPAQDPAPSDASTPSPRSTRPQRNAVPTLTPEQINLMRVYEIDLRNPPKLKVPDDTLRALILRSPDTFSPNEDEREAVFHLPEVEKLKILFKLKARDLYNQVVVLEDPESLLRFKQEVHSQRGWIINACASTKCHGGVNAGGFELINTRPNSNETIYTNLYTIEHYRLKDGSALINYDSPERSPLLQMGMIKKNALSPHPEIPKIKRGAQVRPIFRSTRDRKFRDALEWIRAMYQPRPDYGFAYPDQPEPNQTQTTPPAPSSPQPEQPSP